MGLDELREYCLAKPLTTEGLPFGPDVLVFKVGGKMFALFGLDEPEPRVNLKGDPEENILLRDRYEGVIAGWHMNKKHWNTVYLELDVPPEMIREMIDLSYGLAIKSLTKKKRVELGLD